MVSTRGDDIRTTFTSFGPPGCTEFGTPDELVVVSCVCHSRFLGVGVVHLSQRFKLKNAT
eukprot:scaffold695_cov279-Chaetoceros_neogracile.AAC.47